MDDEQFRLEMVGLTLSQETDGLSLLMKIKQEILLLMPAACEWMLSSVVEMQFESFWKVFNALMFICVAMAWSPMNCT